MGRRALFKAAIALGFLAIASTLIEGSYSDLSEGEMMARFADVRSAFTDIDGVRVHYRDSGFGPTLLLIHGNSSSLHTWEPWVDLMDSHRRLVRLDLPGFGLTGPDPKKRYDFNSLADFLEAFRQRLGLEHFALAGSSHGGRLAWTYALRYPQHVDKLILIDAAGFPLSPWRLALLHVRGATPVRWLADVFTPRILVDWIVRATYGDWNKVTPEMVDRYHALSLGPGGRAAFGDMMGIYDGDEHLRLAALAVPTLIMWGKKDRTIPVEDAGKFVQAISGAELKVYEDVGHLPMEEIPIQSARDLEAFLDR